ncbi:protein AAR2 homolog [Latimeria chalumnae]|uniref:Protein AAR2 homolog n=1 Tax=Latimeria chalumnae TaxID=7897 RepID=H3AT77_LATCH|nr:PREDICTED: protein AAR2 homolog [Latimeria chalumnae]XP_005994431.1 PREDICTED: protein AAR2 homolog [Latimeria chalumnae]XP_005994432.1 PREDICTED: protein AAR2 homolog [Latimeria chalumnae]XP_005994433.1 PREDICTED: protein AAR2 homolog [Latimeria chalumnae]|eukprot:XP_005994430.1 PREDICTED: protein AAR2 homolog [Latimeria chalumnae]
MSATEMDPELAKRLFFEGATLIILNVPERTEFGIDCNTWEVGPLFRGVKMIPPGIHFVHYSSTNKHNVKETSPRSGFFLNLKQREIFLTHWDCKEEEISLSQASEEEVEKMRANLKDLDKFLGPYPYDTLKKWVSLTNHITEPVIKTLMPKNGRISAFLEVLPELPMRHTKDRAEQNLLPYDTQCKSYEEGIARLPKMIQKAGTEIQFTEIPKQKYPEGATPAEITKCSMDLSYALQSVINKYYSHQPLELLAELQFAFVCFLIGNIYDAFEHWKHLLSLLCRSEEAMETHKGLYVSLISVLYHQLNEIPADFFVDIVSKNNFLTTTLQEFFSYSCSPTADRSLRKKAEKFKAHLTKKFRWDFEADLDDCAPVVVELPEGFSLD